MATKPMGQLGGAPRVVAIQPKCYPAQQVACLEFFPEECQMGTSWCRSNVAANQCQGSEKDLFVAGEHTGGTTRVPQHQRVANYTHSL